MSQSTFLCATSALAIFLISGCGTLPATERSDHPLDRFEERNDEPLAAAAHRYQKRLSADGTIPPNAIMRAKRQRDDLLRNDFGAGVWPESWQPIGPGNIGGRLRPIVLDPNDPDIIYVGSASGGVWKTTDGGLWWNPLDDFLPSLSIGDMVMHPEDSQTLFVGTGEGFFETVEGTSNTAAVRGAGIFVTHDAGATWAQIPSTANTDFDFVNRLAFDPTDANVMLAATNTGVWRTTDAGQTWTQQAFFKALDVKFDPNNPVNAVAGGHHEEIGPYYSTDGGLSWQQATGAGGDRQEMAYAPGQAGLVYAAVSGTDGRIKVWRSADGGQSYALQTTGSGIQTWANYNNTIWVDPTNENLLIVGGVRLYRSADGGVTFSRTFSSVHPDMHRVVEHPNFNGVNNKTVYFATDGGIYQTDDIYANSAVDLNNNLAVTQFYGAAVNPDGVVYGGTQDNGTLLYTGDPQGWIHAFGGDGGYGAADQTDPNFLYGEVQRARIHRSRNGGASASYIYNGPNGIDDAASLKVNFIPFYMLDPNDQNRMLVAADRLWRSNNVKENVPDWFSIKESIEPPSPEPPDGSMTDPAHFAQNAEWNIATIDIAEGNADIIWVGHNNGEIWFTADGTTETPTWTRVDEGTSLPNRWPSTIVIDPADHTHLYIAFMGYELDNLWETTDNGQTWTRITGSGDFTLPAAPISACAVHRVRPGWLYVGTDVGVFVSGDNGQSWSTSTSGPGTVPVEQLIWKDDNTLMAVTHGRGIFFADIAAPATLTDLTVTRGNVLSGGLPELGASDDNAFVIHSEKGEFFIEPFVMEFTLGMTTSAPAPTLIDIVIESHVEDAASGIARVYMRNWMTNEFDLIRQFGTNPTDTVEPILDVDAANYVRGTDARIEVQVFQTTITPFVLTGFDGVFDRINVFAR